MKSLRFAFLTLAILGCKNSGGGSSPDMAMATLGPPPTLAMSCADQRADVYNLPGNLGAMDDSHRGEIFHCAVSESMTALKLNTMATAYGYAGPSLPSGAWTFRIAYRTERLKPATGAAPEGDSAAVLLVPDKPLAGAPLVVFAHGSVGIAPRCAPSRLDLTMLPAHPTDADFPVNIYALAGYGYTVIMPDYAGFSYAQPPGYFVAEDEAHSVLDATPRRRQDPAVAARQGRHRRPLAGRARRAGGARLRQELRPGRHAGRRRHLCAVLDLDGDLGRHHHRHRQLHHRP